MHVTSFSADGYKNLKSIDIKPDRYVNLITGNNAQGKTNLLEAIWIMTGCRSFRGSRERDYIALDGKIMRNYLEFDDGRRIQKISYALSRDSLKNKKISLNGIEHKGTSKLFEQFKCVVFTPDDTELIKGGPEKRRSFADLCACQLRPKSLEYVKNHENILAQRNAALKVIAYDRKESDTLEIWNGQLSLMGAYISKMRMDYIKKLDEICRELYYKITCGKEKLTISYNSNIYGYDVPEYSAEVIYYEKLEESINEDIKVGFTTRGAHRDDIIIKIDGLSIKEYGSQGQKKSAALVLKLAQASLYWMNRDESPVILLDDVMGELDSSRQALVFETVKNMQVFITACNENSILKLSEGKHFYMENGVIQN